MTLYVDNTNYVSIVLSNIDGTSLTGATATARVLDMGLNEVAGSLVTLVEGVGGLYEADLPSDIPIESGRYYFVEFNATDGARDYSSRCKHKAEIRSC